MRKVAVVLGTRPEGIKMAPVIKALEARDDMQPIVVSTGQHRELLDQVIEVFGIRVDHDLALMRPDQTLAQLSARLLTSVDALLIEERPDLVLVQGDTSTVLFTALACFYRHVPVGHVEAGLRTWNLQSPFPEEANRRLASPLATLHFAPTERARENLLREGVSAGQIEVTGNTVVDALFLEVERQETRSDVRAEVDARLGDLIGEDWQERPLILVTGHRRESFGRGFEEICDALSAVAERFGEYRIVYPVHLNPNVRGPVHERLGDRPNIHLIPPQGYREFVALMRAARLILTDSGGVQEEAPSLGKPVVVLRDTTERPEGIDAGTVVLAGASARAIQEKVSALLTDRALYDRMSRASNPYGDGLAAGRIVERIAAHFATCASG